MTDNIVKFPGAELPDHPKNLVTADSIIEAAKGRYEDLILIGRPTGSGTYECVSTSDVSETLYHVVRVQHRLNVFLDGKSRTES